MSILRTVVLAFAFVAALAPGVAGEPASSSQEAGDAVREQADARAREAARQEAAEEQRRRRESQPTLDERWDDATRDAGRTRVRDVVGNRVVAVVVGLVWLYVALRLQRRRRRSA